MAQTLNAYDMITRRFIGELKNGNIPWQKAWKGCPPMNYYRRETYRGINKFLLPGGEYLSMREINEKEKRGAKLKEDAKEYPLVFFSVYDKPDKKNPNIKKKQFVLKYYTVYHINDVEGFESKVANEEHNSIEKAEEIVKNFKDCPKIVHDDWTGAYYNLSKDVINMPPKESFPDIEKYYSTLYTEMINSMLHKNRLNWSENIKDEESYSRNRLTAEFGATMLCSIAGIENKTIDNKPEAIQYWISTFNDDARIIMQAACNAQKAVDYIMGEKV